MQKCQLNRWRLMSLPLLRLRTASLLLQRHQQNLHLNLANLNLLRKFHIQNPSS